MNESENNQTPVEALGKFGLIDHIIKKAKVVNKSTVSGIGDDAAIIENGNLFTLISTDLLLGGIHFNDRCH